MALPRENVIGNKYGRLLVTGDAPYKGKSRQVAVLCECGNTLNVNVSNLKKGTTTSCGCFHKSRITSHGKSQDPMYKTWHGMMERCYNPSHEAFSRYGGRGITVIPEWHDVANFILWVIQSDYSPKLTLDRKDNEKGYSPENCRWASKNAQQRNRRAIAGGTSEYIGVCLHKRTGKWKAHIKINGVLHHLGYHLTELDAAKARDRYIIDNNLEDFTMNGVL